jgi:hypothetical protein
MGLFKLLTFPVSGPVSGTRWVLQTVLDEAERRHYDPVAIRQQMADLEAQHRTGGISDEEFDRREEALLERLIESREYHQRKQGRG